MGQIFKGYNGQLIVENDHILIKRNIFGALSGLHGEKLIPFKHIVAVQHKKSGFIPGFIQITLRGGFEGGGSYMQTAYSENAVTYTSRSKKKQEEAEEIAKIIQQKILTND